MEKYSRKNFFKKVAKATAGIGIMFGLDSIVRGSEKSEPTLRIRSNSNDLESLEKPKSPYAKWENTKRELREVVKSYGKFPTQKELYETGRVILTDAIKKYHGGFATVRKKFLD